MSVRPGRRRARIAAAIAAVLAWSLAAGAPIDVVRDCAANSSPAISGIKNLSAACPQLEDALHSLGMEQMLYDGWQERLNRDALQDLANLTEGYGGSKSRDSPDVAALPGILKAMERERTPLTRSWWEAFSAWFKNWLSHHSGTLTWLDRWLDRIGQAATLVNVISYSLVGLVLIAAVAVIVNELKASGPIRGRRDRESAARASSPAVSSPLEPGALADRLTELLRILVNRLIETRRLATERSLTHRELVARSVFDDESQRAVFAAVAGTAEMNLYGPYGAAQEELNRVLTEGRALLAQLSNPSSAR